MYDKEMKIEDAIKICIKLNQKLRPLDNVQDPKEAYIEKDALEKLIDCAISTLYHD